MTAAYAMPDRFGLADRYQAVAAGVLASIVVVIWTYGREAEIRYILYLLPPLLVLSSCMLTLGRPAINRDGLYALMAYLPVAFAAMAFNNRMEGFAVRDLYTIGSIILMFAIWFRASRVLADIALAGLTVGMVMVAITEGVGTNITALKSQGILETTLAFPIGVVTLYYFQERSWGRFLLACVILFLAYKRIAMLAVVAIIMFEMASYLVFRRSFGRFLTTLAVLVLSVVSLFLPEIFEFLSAIMRDEDASASAISLGRTGLAEALRFEIHEAGLSHMFFGFGPGSADDVVFALGEIKNPHNDWLKILFDYGLVGFIVLHGVLYLIHPRTPLGNKLYLNLAILMVTDNPLIYIHYFAFVFLVSRIVPEPADARPRRRWI